MDDNRTMRSHHRIRLMRSKAHQVYYGYDPKKLWTFDITEDEADLTAQLVGQESLLDPEHPGKDPEYNKLSVTPASKKLRGWIHRNGSKPQDSP